MSQVQDFFKDIDLVVHDFILSYADQGDFLSILVRPENLKACLQALRDHETSLMKVMVDITAVDYLGKGHEKRFEVNYQLLSLRHNARLCVKVWINEDEVLTSITEVFPNALWYEREVWDMYGLAFDGNSDLRRILTDYGFEGHPLRKDFPLTGYVEMRYDESLGRCVYEPLYLPQDYRSFDFESPWQGMIDVVQRQEQDVQSESKS